LNHEETLLALLESHRNALSRIARLYAGSDDAEEDLYQEILMQTWKALPSFRGDAAASTWLYRIALNTALTWRRREARRTVHEATSGEEVSGRSVSASPVRSDGEILREVLSSLDGPSRSVLVLYKEGLTHEEIARVTGLSSGAVGVRLHRMKLAFRERYTEGSS
jgi:RNA polymerase sigma-70 factor (ECF subfamily)